MRGRMVVRRRRMNMGDRGEDSGLRRRAISARTWSGALLGQGLEAVVLESLSTGHAASMTESVLEVASLLVLFAGGGLVAALFRWGHPLGAYQ